MHTTFYNLRTLLLPLSVSITIALPHSAVAKINKCQALFSAAADISINSNTRALVVTNEFNTWRSFNEYISDFGPLFKKKLVSLDESQLWLDSGAGLARAQIEFLQGSKDSSPELIAASYKYPKVNNYLRRSFSGYTKYKKEFSDALLENKLKYVEGDIAYLETRVDIGGRVDLITDNVGPATYSDFGQILATYGSLLNNGGIAFVSMPRIRMVDDASGAEIPSKLFFSRIEGFEVSVFDRAPNTLLVLKRNGSPLFIPPIETLGAVVSMGGYGSYFSFNSTDRKH